MWMTGAHGWARPAKGARREGEVVRAGQGRGPSVVPPAPPAVRRAGGLCPPGLEGRGSGLVMGRSRHRAPPRKRREQAAESWGVSYGFSRDYRQLRSRGRDLTAIPNARD